MLIIFVVTSFSELKHGDDPYKILGLTKDATKEQIKKSYRKLTYELHPDISKNENTRTEWIRVNDAYELLTDPDRKEMFDRTGSVGQLIKQEFMNKFTEEDFRFYQNNNDIMQHNFILLTQVNYEKILNKKDTEFIILIYSKIFVDNSNRYISLFKSFDKTYGKLINCVAIDASVNSDLASQLGARHLPSFIHIDKKGNKNYLSEKIFMVKDILDFWISTMDIHYYEFSSVKELDYFLKFCSDCVHVVQVVRHYDATVFYKRLVRDFKDYKKIHFGVYLSKNDYETSKLFNISSFPNIILYRNNISFPTVIGNVKDAYSTIDKYKTSTFFNVNKLTFERNCADMCFLRIGHATKEQMRYYIGKNITTGYCSENSYIPRFFNMNNGNWIIFSLSSNSYRIVDEDIIRNTMIYGNFNQIPKNFSFPYDSGYLKIILFDIMYMYNITISKLIVTILLCLFFVFTYITRGSFRF